MCHMINGKNSQKKKMVKELDAVLIGEALMKALDKKAKLQELRGCL